MDLYIMGNTADNKLKRLDIITGYKSAIWTERFRGPGETEIEMISTETVKRLLTPGKWLCKAGSARIMEIHTCTDDVDEEGERILKVVGEEISTIFQRRVARKYNTPLSESEEWIFEYKSVPQVMREIFAWILVDGVFNPLDKLDWYEPTTTLIEPVYPASDIPEPDVIPTIKISLASIAEVYDNFLEGNPNIGYRLYYDPKTDTGLYFDVYTGMDRTVSQSTNEPVVFSLPLGSLTNTSDVESMAEYYNVCYVFSEFGQVVVSETPEPTNFNRRCLYLKIDTDQEIENLRGNELKAYLKSVGELALGEHRRIVGFDGEVPEFTRLMYGVDYNLGDLVTLLGDTNGSTMRIIEHISTEDQEGDRNYPTFEMVDMIEEGTWSAQLDGQTWSTVPGYWSTS